MPSHNILGDILDESSEQLTNPNVTVPNVLPRITNTPYRIGIIGEAPGKDEIEQGKPFVGYSGKELDRFLSRFGILRDACFIGNVCQHRPGGNKIANFDWNGREIVQGINILRTDLQNWRPNVILLLGGSALHAFKEPNLIPRKTKKGDDLSFSFPHSISDWRGSFFMSHPDSPCPETKCIASYHPAFCLRSYEYTPMLMLDISRAKNAATTRELVLPQRDLLVDCSFERICYNLDELYESSKLFGADIEGYWNNFKCISFATSPSHSFIVPFVKMNGDSLWSVDEELILMQKVARLLANPRQAKVWQNGLYDRFCLQYGYNMISRGPQHDIMLRHWENLCELEKSLAVQASIYTDEPYYKAEIRTQDRETFWRYCCKDSALTIEIYEKLNRQLQPHSQAHAKFNEELTNALLYMECRGFKYDTIAAASRLESINGAIFELQHSLDSISGFGLGTTDKTILRALLRDSMCYKRDSSKVKEKYTKDFDINMRTLLGEGNLTSKELGRLSIALGKNLNTKGEDLKNYLYDTLKLPKQYHPITGAVTTDYESLLHLNKLHPSKQLRLIIDIGELRTRAQMLAITTDTDGRVRAGYNEVGSETGRVTCYTSPTGSGYNIQTLPDENELKPPGHHLALGMRDLLIADEGCYLAKCDLKGADGWTVGANLAALGDSTMLDDLKFGLKPASVLCYGRRHGVSSVTGKNREDLASLCKEVKKSDWDYFAYKQCIWGFCYLMGVRKAASHVFKLSEGEVTVSEADMQLAKDMLFRRYNISLWHRAMENKLYKQPYPPKLLSPSGHERKFFGRKSDILGQALAHEPQSVTTFATNRAVYNCWTDPDNRRVDNSLRVEPMHQVHDEFVCQFRQEDLEFAKAKIRQWFNNTITIAGIPIVIPYDGAYGTDWSMSEKSKKGSI